MVPDKRPLALDTSLTEPDRTHGDPHSTDRADSMHPPNPRFF
jgi:hypothetical protein